MPPVVATTAKDLAVVRFHGRRTATWEDMKGRATVERFRYLYDEGELREWVPRIAQAATQATDTHVLMNNCYANYGSTNARELAKLLEARARRRSRPAEARRGPTMSANAVPGFLPSTHGFAFANAWPPGPTIRIGPLDPRRLGIADASAGLCGGMVMTVRDLFESGPERRGAAAARERVAAVPGDRPSPGPVAGLLPGPAPLLRPDGVPPGPAHGHRARCCAASRRGSRRWAREWPAIREALDAGRLGPARPDPHRRHVAVGTCPGTTRSSPTRYDAADDGSRFAIRIYDPNHPGRDDVELRAEVDPDDGRPLRERVRLDPVHRRAAAGVLRPAVPAAVGRARLALNRRPGPLAGPAVRLAAAVLLHAAGRGW